MINKITKPDYLVDFVGCWSDRMCYGRLKRIVRESRMGVAHVCFVILDDTDGKRFIFFLWRPYFLR